LLDFSNIKNGLIQKLFRMNLLKIKSGKIFKCRQ
jgi:hypothetical protein